MWYAFLVLSELHSNRGFGMRYREHKRTIIIAILLILTSGIAWYHIGSRFLSHVGISIWGQSVPGFIINSEEKSQEVYDETSDKYGEAWNTWLQYTYKLPDGRKFTSSCELEGRLEPWLKSLSKDHQNSNILDGNTHCPIEVQYLPKRPEISIIKGTVRSIMWDEGFLLLFCALPALAGYNMLKDIPHEPRKAPIPPEVAEAIARLEARKDRSEK